MATINAAVDGIVLTADSSATLSLATSGVIRATIDPAGQTGIGFTPLTTQGNLQVYKLVSGGAPVTSGTTDANQVFAANASSVQLSYGAYADGTGWIQQRAGGNFAVNYALAMQPNGGNVGIGKVPTVGRLLDVNGDAWLNGVRVGTGAGSVSTNTAVGSNALTANTSGTVNTAVGEGALASNTSGAGNNAFGRNALANNTTGFGNVAIGSSDAGTLAPLQLNTTGYYNVAVGNGALYANTTGYVNTAVGRSCLVSNTTGNANAAVGYATLQANTTGNFNAALGASALQKNTTGYYNTAIGYGSQFECTTGYINSSVGMYTLLNITSGFGNSAIGYYAGYGLTTGVYNVMIGNQAGYQYVPGGMTTGTGNIMIGSYSDGAAAGDSYEIVIGYASQGKGTSTGFINPYSGGSVYQGNNTTTWATTSDRRIKKNIVDNNDGLAKINQLRVRNFEYRTEDEVDPELPKSAAIKVSGVQLGVIAQEIQEVLPECVKEESTGVLSVNSDRLIWHLVNAVKELSAEVNALKAKLE